MNASPSKPDRTDHAAIASAYARDVVAGRILACKWVRLACQRHLTDLGRTDWPYVFDAARAGRACRFIEALPHTKGEWARGERNQIRLEPWQCFILSSVFGWVHRETQVRRFRLAYILIPRKNGKSILAAGVGLYMLAADGEMGAEVYAGATCERQAWEVFRPAKLMVERTPDLAGAFGVRAGSKGLQVLSTGSRFEPVVAKPGDGSSPSCGIVDEYHEHKTDELVDTFRTGMGARKQPLLWVITTAGSNLAGPCHAMQRDLERVLEGSIVRDDVFGIVYTVDQGQDWTSEEALKTANPNYDVSVSSAFLKAEQTAAIQSARKQNVFLTKHLNVWVGANTAFINAARWKELGDPKLKREQFKGELAYAAVDLSSKLDITARVLLFRKKLSGAHHYYVFGRYYIPAERLKEPELEHYRGWAIDGYLETTPGHVIDYPHLTEQTISELREFKVKEIGFDPWNAEHFAQECAKATPAIAIEIPQQIRYLSEPMKQLEALVTAGRLHHDGNPVLAWMMSNVVAHMDAKGNVFPRKEAPQNKIDGAVALIMALSRALHPASAQRSVYSTRGILTL